MCQKCSIRPSKYVATYPKTGKRYYTKVCKTCEKYPDLKEKAFDNFCRGCNQKYHPIQLDIDHVNGDSSDGRYENLQVLCANCHRLKTHLCKEHHNKEYK